MTDNEDDIRIRPTPEEVHEDIYGDDGSIRLDFLAIVGAVICCFCASMLPDCTNRNSAT